MWRGMENKEKKVLRTQESRTGKVEGCGGESGEKATGK